EHTFVVMAYGNSPFLPECLDSLLCQTVRGEICIATSTPSGYLSEQAMRAGATLFVTGSGKGIAHDWNFALRQARTRYVTLAHQDDLYSPTYAERCLNAMRPYPDALICFTDYTELAGGVIRTDSLLLFIKRCMLHFFMPFRRLRSQFWKTRLLSLGCPIAAPGVFYKLENLGDFQFSPSFSLNMDWDAWSRIALLDGYFFFRT
ncbi:MAG: glycosyltransferase family 2 protein, partial [Bacteroidota bacterium]